MQKPNLKAVQPSIEGKLHELNEDYAVVRWSGQTLIMEEKYGEGGKNGGKRKLSFQPKDGFLLWNANNIFWEETSNGSTKKVSVARRWLEWELRRQYSEVLFAPNAKPEPHIYNLWRGFSYKPEANKGKFDIFLDHIRTNICNEDEAHYNWVIGWMADLVQRPERKLGTSLVLRGKMGVGKGVVFKHLGALVSRHYLMVQKTEHVTGRFNGHLADTLLLFLDEAFWAGNKEAEGTLKSLITEDDVTIEMKGKDLIRTKSYLRIGMSTNNDWAVPTGLEDERRFAVFDVGERCQQNRPYFIAMEDELINGGYEALLHFLLNYKYDANDIGTIPKTEALLDQKLLGMPVVLKWWYECLCDRNISQVMGDGWEIEISRKAFYESYLNYCKQMNIRHPVGKTRLTSTMNKLKLKFKEEQDRQTKDGWFFKILSIAECRASFEAVIGHKMKWESGNE